MTATRAESSRAVDQTDNRAADAAHAQRSLDRAHGPVLQRQLFLLWHRTEVTPLNLLAGTAMAKALVYMRRTGRAQYDARDHARRQVQERRLSVTSTVEATRRMAFPEGTPVCVLGEFRTGTITHIVVEYDYDHPYPAVWYVVAAPLRRVCRAHGADEIEGALAPRVHPANGPVTQSVVHEAQPPILHRLRSNT
ncbi:hypothetical protein [Streptomyces sp. NPDC059278]|uniref:hypothetical protein n=1 Tax=Streptomyces sp. NPDC059278 TaxID=3346801 RepID=UPI0036B79EC5